MHVGRIAVSNFRGIAKAEVELGGTSILLGDNNTGKTTLLEALDLVLGPERLYRRPPIDEHDFHAGRYLDQAIEIEVTILGLDEELLSRFRANLELWDANQRTVLEEANGDESEFCLRLKFVGRYESDDDDFVGETWFASPVLDGEPINRFTTSDKRAIGFLFLRALRTGSRAMSLERGSLLDVVLRAFEIEVQMWERLLGDLRDVAVAGAENPDFGSVLTSLDAAMTRIVSSEWAEAPHLRVSDLTREDLRHVLRAFMATGAAGYSAPFNHQGSGTTNSLVIAMLSLIAEKRDGRVIFAMEEPETSLPPTAQKRVVDLIRGLASQAIFTSHSPYVLEEFEPGQMIVVGREHSTGVLRSTAVVLDAELRPKVFREGLRTRFCEALLARRILVCEGKSEANAYPLVAKIASRQDPATYARLDTSGWAVFDAQGETNVASFSRFFGGLGKTVAAVFDEQTPGQLAEIEAAADLTFEQPYKGFEALLTAEIEPAVKRRYVDTLVSGGDWPTHIVGPEHATDDAYDQALMRLLTKTKGEDFALRLIESLSIEELPTTILNAIATLRSSTQPSAPTESVPGRQASNADV